MALSRAQTVTQRDKTEFPADIHSAVETTEDDVLQSEDGNNGNNIYKPLLASDNSQSECITVNAKQKSDDKPAVSNLSLKENNTYDSRSKLTSNYLPTVTRDLEVNDEGDDDICKPLLISADVHCAVQCQETPDNANQNNDENPVVPPSNSTDKHFNENKDKTSVDETQISKLEDGLRTSLLNPEDIQCTVECGGDDVEDLLASVDFPLQIDLPDLVDDKMNLSFSGCGFLGMYHLGACAAMVAHGAPLLGRVKYFGGASAGALVAAALVVRGVNQPTIEMCKDFVMDLSAKIRSHKLGALTPGVSMLSDVEKFVRNLVPDDAYRLASKQLFISLTLARGKKNVLVTDFTSNDHLIKCLMATSYVPFITGSSSVTIDGVRYLDGGITDNLPILDEGRTIRITPFSGGQEICPRDHTSRPLYTRVNGQNFQVNSFNVMRGIHGFFPPSCQRLQKYYTDGYCDAIRYMKKEGLYLENKTY